MMESKRLGMAGEWRVNLRYLPSLGGVTLHQLRLARTVAGGKCKPPSDLPLKVRLTGLVKATHCIDRAICISIAALRSISHISPKP